MSARRDRYNEEVGVGMLEADTMALWHAQGFCRPSFDIPSRQMAMRQPVLPFFLGERARTDFRRTECHHTQELPEALEYLSAGCSEVGERHAYWEEV